jgi:two-component system chemotaxis response regulator CheB
VSEAVSLLPDALVVGTANDGAAALAKLDVIDVDIVLLDVEMPVLNGLETLKQIRRQFPEIGVIMVSGVSAASANVTIDALQSGALDFITKPEGKSPIDSKEILGKKLAEVIQGYRLTRRHSPSTNRITPSYDSQASVRKSDSQHERFVGAPNQVELVTIGVSTGGPNALLQLLPRLPADFSVPILIVQHMPPLFTLSLAKSLDKHCRLRVKEAEDGEVVARGTIYIAPGGYHMLVEALNSGGHWKVKISQSAPENNCRPSVDVLFRSAAQSTRGGVLAVVMTGMGTDGQRGVQTIKEMNRGYCLAQDEPSSVVYGMPRAVVEGRLADEVVSLSCMHDRITAWVKNPGIASKSSRANS